MKRSILIYAVVLISFSSCVTARRLNDMETERNLAESLNDELTRKNEDLEVLNLELDAKIRNQESLINALEADTALLGTSIRHIRTQYDKINELYDLLNSKSTELLGNAADENRLLLEELGIKETELQTKEDQLMILTTTLNEKEETLGLLEADLNARSQRLEELEALLAEKDAAAKALKDLVTNALAGFESEGLTIVEKDGKVYVSLEANLLFPSGSTSIYKEGEEALIELAKAVENQSDLEVIVEGHTDSDGIISNKIPNDNWELSVLRATSVVKIMTENSNISPQILTASGRSQYHPVDESDKSKNRRIEIILAPDLSELFDIID